MRPLTLSALALALVGCEKDDPDPGPPPVPVVTRDGPALVDAHPGEALTLRAFVRQADGTPAQGYELDWGAPCVPPTTPPEPGVEACTWTPTTLGTVGVTLRVTVCDGPRWNPTMHCPSTTETVAWVRVWGGAPEAVVTPYRAASLVVGEVRALQGIALADRAVSHVAPTYTTDDSAVATVDAHGVVTARAPGSTTLRITAATHTKTIPITVSDGPLGPPPAASVVSIVSRDDDTVSSNGFAEIGVNLRRDGSVALAPDGDPWLTYRTTMVVDGVGQTQVRPAWVSAWTGSGFSYESVGERWDDVLYPQLVLDDAGGAWLLFYSGQHDELAVMRRAAPGRWERVALPALADPTAPRPPSGEGVATYLQSSQAESIPMTIHPRPGGGAHAAYIVWGRASEAELTATGHGCARSVRLVTLGPDGALVATEDVARALYGDNRPDTDCGAWASLDDFTVHALFLAPDPAAPSDPSTPPRVLVVKEALDRGFVEVAARGASGWQARTIVPWSEPGSVAAYEQAPVQLTVVRPDDPADGAAPTRLYWIGRGTFLADLEALIAGDAEPRVDFAPRSGGGYPGDQVLFAAMAGGAIYSGTSTLGPLGVLRPDGRVSVEDPTARLFPVEDPYQLEPYHLYTLVRGAAGDLSRLHLTWGQGDLAYATLDVPVFARPDDPESDGRRLGAEPTTPVPTRPPLVLPEGLGGGRLLPTDQGLLASSGPGAPWTLVRARDGHLRDDVFVAGGALWGFSQDTAGAIDVVRSDDGGANWSTIWTIDMPANLSPGAAVVTADGVPLVASGGRLWRASTGTPAELTTGMARLDHLVVHGAEVVALGFDPEGSIRVIRLDADGAIVAASPAAPSGAPRLFAEDLQTAIVTADGRVCLRTQGSTGAGLALAVHCLAADLSAWSSHDVPGDAWWWPAPLVALADGRVALGAARVHAFEDRRTVVTLLGPAGWSEPVALRPPPIGGYGQRVYGLVEEGGTLLALIGDNGSWRAWTGGELQVGEAAYDTLVVSAPIPGDL